MNHHTINITTIPIPADKSISHRALILSSISDKKIIIKNLLFAEDVVSTMNAMRALGVRIDASESTSQAIVHGVGLHGLQKPTKVIDCGNSGTTMRLLTGLLSAQSFDSVLIGDYSLMQRPMLRVATPLRLMGAHIELSSKNTAPIHIHGNPQLHNIIYESPIASAQVKSAILIASLYTKHPSIVIESTATRDHTERMLRTLSDSSFNNDIEVPADFSSAAFFIALACITPHSQYCIPNVGVNDQRIGMLHILKKMGADITLENKRYCGLEPVADIRIRYAPLKGVVIDTAHVASAIDEFPAIFIVAAHARGTTLLRNAGELRVKETDRINAMAEGLTTLGVSVNTFDDGIEITGAQSLSGASITTYNDHRIAMAFSIAACSPLLQSTLSIDNTQCIDTSFPGFLSRFC